MTCPPRAVYSTRSDGALYHVMWIIALHSVADSYCMLVYLASKGIYIKPLLLLNNFYNFISYKYARFVQWILEISWPLIVNFLKLYRKVWYCLKHFRRKGAALLTGIGHNRTVKWICYCSYSLLSRAALRLGMLEIVSCYQGSNIWSFAFQPFPYDIAM